MRTALIATPALISSSTFVCVVLQNAVANNRRSPPLHCWILKVCDDDRGIKGSFIVFAVQPLGVNLNGPAVLRVTSVRDSTKSEKRRLLHQRISALCHGWWRSRDSRKLAICSAASEYKR